MFAAVEFAKRQCYVVPLNWLVEDQKKCYWPRISNEEELLKCIMSSVAPKPSWTKYTVVNILQFSSTYEEANSYLKKTIEESESEETVALILKDISDDIDNTEPPKKKYKSNQIDCSDSDDEVSDNNAAIEDDEKTKSNNYCSAQFSDDSDWEQSRCTVDSTKDKNTPTQSQQSTSATLTTISDQSTPNSSVVVGRKISTTDQIVLKRIEQLIATQEQHTIMLQNILRSLQSQLATQQRPDGYPNIPVANKKEYQDLEQFLKEEKNFSYMKTRLACIGGINLRNCVMNMLKFLLTNQVAMKFNWAGRDKRPFKNTNIAKVIFEAVRLTYNTREPADLTDKSIKESIQDWLKLAKSRFHVGLSKKENQS